MSDLQRQRKALQLVAVSLELDPAERAGFLDEHCGDDVGLRQEIEEILAQEETTGDDLLATRATLVPVTEPVVMGETVPIPEYLGSFRVGKRLGRGGMGSVYLGEQEGEIRRTVALKTITTLYNNERRDRFTAECRALARLNHPNVAALYEVGVAEPGIPYVAMELVDGEPITTWCDEHALGLKDRLQLFLGACAGVRHAHEKGILHRDLKPENILVTKVDGVATAKVIDFGIAASFAEPLLNDIRLTLDAQIVGSPSHLSPEAASLGKVDVDTRSDVFSLGLVLYELTVGVLPFEVDNVSLAEHIQRLTKQDLLAPSRRLSTLPQQRQQAIAQRRGNHSRALIRAVQGDLDTIIGKATARDPQLRYGSPSELAADLDRYLKFEPIRAQPPSSAYFLRRFVRRRAGVVLSLCLLICALVAGVVARSVESQRARRAEARALAEAAAAKSAQDESEEVTRFLVDLFRVADPQLSQNQQVTARELLEVGARRIETELADQPELRARMMLTIGRIYRRLGMLDKAVPLIEQGVEIQQAVLRADHPDLATSYSELGVAYHNQGRSAESEPLFRRSIAIREKTYGPNHQAVLNSRHNLAVFLAGQGKLQEAESLLRDIIEHQDGDHLAKSLTNLSSILSAQGRFAEAEPYATRAQRLIEETLGSDHPDYARMLVNVGNICAALDRPEEAASHFQQALSVAEATLGPEHPTLVPMLHNLALMYFESNELEKAEPCLQRALAIDQRRLGPEHPLLAKRYSGLAQLALLKGELPLALQRYEKARELLTKEGTGRDQRWIELYWGLAEVAAAQARPARAAELYEQAIAVSHEVGFESHAKYPALVKGYTEVLHKLGRDAEAQELDAASDSSSGSQRGVAATER